MGAGSGATQSKYVARRETPVYIAENCTQCMECITACPDTALPNTAQDVATVLKTAAVYYVTDDAERARLVAGLKGLEQRARARMNDSIKAKSNVPFKDIIREEVNALPGVAETAKAQFGGIIGKLPHCLLQRPCHLPFPRTEDSGGGRGVFHFCVRPLQRLRRMRPSMRRPRRPADDHGNRGVERRT